VRIAHGMLNLCHRDSMEHPSPLPPGAAVTAEVVLDEMAYCVAPGHHLRLALSTTYWPFLWPSPVAATLTLEEGSLALPVHSGGQGDEWVAPPPTSAPPAATRALTPAHAARRVETDLITGRVALVVEDRSGRVESLEHGLIVEENMAERFEVDPADPGHALARCVWEQRQARGDWAIRTHAVAEMRGTPDALVFHATLQAWEGETLVFERLFSDQVARDFI